MRHTVSAWPGGVTSGGEGAQECEGLHHRATPRGTACVAGIDHHLSLSSYCSRSLVIEKD